MKIHLLALASIAMLAGGVFAQGPKVDAETMLAAIKAVKEPPLDQTQEATKPTSSSSLLHARPLPRSGRI